MFSLFNYIIKRFWLEEDDEYDMARDFLQGSEDEVFFQNGLIS